MSAWSDEAHVELAKKLWMEGLSASQVSAQLWRAFQAQYSRNAVIGKLHRMGLTGAGSGRSANVSQSLGHINAKASVGQRAKARTLKLAGSGTVFEEAEAHAPRLAPPPAATWAPLEGVEPVPLSGLRHTHCRWPLELADATEPMSCGALKIGGAYCPTHAAMSRPKVSSNSHWTPAMREAAAHRVRLRNAERRARVA
jgi:GcrA cell cycle regulator